MNRTKTAKITTAAMIAALYVVLTYLTNLFGLANGAIQVRFSEMLTVLPYFLPSAVPGLAVGCLISNILTGCALWDVIFGTLATLLGALGTHFIAGKWLHTPWLSAAFPVFSNTVILPFILKYAYGFPGSLIYFAVTVGVGELISAGLLGTVLVFSIKKYAVFNMR